MNECVDCGRPVRGGSAYCEDCANRDGDGPTTTTTASVDDRVSSLTSRAVAVLLAAGALLGGATVLQSLQYAPVAVSAGRPLDAVGFLVVQAVNATLVVGFAVMAKRLFEGRGDRARYGRIVRILAVASVVSGVLVTVLPNPLVRWLPTVVDPAYVVLNVLAFALAPSVFASEAQTLAVGVVGASVSFVAGTALQRDVTE
ncbi:hypothetical protein [Halorubellus sp. PRR65]|uniref:hypothetical protein n=1 Tax=Halorubellus sp. PRR65 TaxID=3098148 RepID=UPI002B25C613|nr:hypothetical protein [Halorubellus sp. PRR65]